MSTFPSDRLFLGNNDGGLSDLSSVYQAAKTPALSLGLGGLSFILPSDASCSKFSSKCRDEAPSPMQCSCRYQRNGSLQLRVMIPLLRRLFTFIKIRWETRYKKAWTSCMSVPRDGTLRVVKDGETKGFSASNESNVNIIHPVYNNSFIAIMSHT